MRILSIKLKNINSLRGEFELDFTTQPLKDAGLFAMIGKMGSGKSTILDCITLALFNAIPRYNKVSKDAIEKGGLILTKNERDCYAEVKYSCKSGVYTSRWSISKTRNDTLRDYEMQVSDENGKPLTEKKTEVPLKNAELIGLNYDQFNKSILLSQGEFAKFLKSSKNERAQLLEEITATKDFRRLGRLAFFVYGRKKKEIDDQLRLIEDRRKTLLPEEERKELKNQIAIREGAVGNAKTQSDDLKNRIDLRRRVIQLQMEIEKKKRKDAEAQLALEEFDNKNAETLKHYAQLLPFKEKINEYVSKEEELLKLNKDLEDGKTRDERLETRVEELVKEVSGWVKKKISSENFFDELEAFKDLVSAKTTRYKQYISEMAAAIVRINTAFNPAFLSEERSLFHVVGKNDKLIQKLHSRLDDGEFLFKKHMEGHELVEGQLGPTRLQLQESIGELGLLQTDVKNFIQNIGRIKDNAKRKETIQSAFTDISAKSESLKTEQENLEALFTKAEEERKRMLTEQTLDAYRSQLVAGEPCPLCGSESHPYVHEYAKDLSKADDQYNRAKQSLAEKRKELQDALLKKSSTETQLSSVMEMITRDELDNKSAKENIDRVKKKLGIDNIGSVDAVGGFITVYKEKLAAVEFCMDYLASKPAIGLLLEELGNFDNAQVESDELNKEIQEMYSGEDIQRDYKQRRDAMQSAIDQRKEIQTGMASCKSAIKSLESALTNGSNELKPGLSALGYGEIKDAKAKIISESVFHQLTQRRGELDNELQLAKKLLSEDIHRLSIESANDDPAITIESLLLEQKRKDAEFEQLNKALEDAKLKYRIDEETQKDIRQIEENIQDQRKANLPWELLCRFIGDKTGNTFNNFAQELTLKHLLNFANRRLQKLHSRYILSMPLDVEDDDLVVVDTNMGNERRSVKTLSGGETFIISLSLALGLSDLASRDVLIESLFIDEGFGTLDPEVLETTIGTLEQLQAESNKTVGIISHVDSMRERIYTQVQLEKQQNGFSTMKIYPETS